MKVKRYAEMSISEGKINNRLVMLDGDGLRIQVRKKKHGQPHEIMIEMDVIGNHVALSNALAEVMKSFIDGALDDDDCATRCYMMGNAASQTEMYALWKLEEIEARRDGDQDGKDAES